MRRYFAKVTDSDGHPDLNENHVEIRDSPFVGISKGDEGIMQLRDIETQEVYGVKVIALGYHDFEDEEDYEERLSEVVAEKLDEQGLEHSIGEDE
jgi:hypothetical protein